MNNKKQTISIVENSTSTDYGFTISSSSGTSSIVFSDSTLAITGTLTDSTGVWGTGVWSKRTDDTWLYTKWQHHQLTKYERDIIKKIKKLHKLIPESAAFSKRLVKKEIDEIEQGHGVKKSSLLKLNKLYKKYKEVK